MDPAAIQRRVAEMLELVRLPDLGKRRPGQLFGGPQQRVALARALITKPWVLLLDEPLSNLDAHLRDEMRSLVLGVQRQLEVTTVMVTHDQQDAPLLADRIAPLFDGVLQQYCPPPHFYRQPASECVARFFGGVNFLPATWTGERTETSIGSLYVELPGSVRIRPGPVTRTIRPEQIQLGVDGSPIQRRPIPAPDG